MVSYSNDRSTASRVLQTLEKYGLKQEKPNQYRCKASPLRAGSNSNAFVLTIENGEHGAYYDHVTNEAGSLYELAELLDIPIVKDRVAVESTKRPYKNADDYARAHGITVEDLRNANITQAGQDDRPALAIVTSTGTRYRFLDGIKPVYKSPVGYKRCWYRLIQAVRRSENSGQSLVLCNGEISTVVGQHYGLAATCITGGEKTTIPDNLLAELKQAYMGSIIVAYDCDPTGRNASIGIMNQLHAAGLQAKAVDLGLTDGGDLADFCRLHGQDSSEHLQELSPLQDTALVDGFRKGNADLSDAADYWANMNPDIAWDDDNQIWRRWNGRFWQDNVRQMELDQLTEDALLSVGLSVTSGNRLNTVLRLAQSRCRRDFASKPDLINFRNGTFALSSKGIQPHRDADNLITCLPFDYAQGRFDQIAKWLTQSTPDPWGQCAYMAHIGLALLQDVGQHKALVLWGPPRSGKTTALALGQMATGQPILSFAHEVLFENTIHGSDSRAQWRNRLLVCVDEWPEDALRDDSSEEIMKGIIAHSGVTTRKMFKSEDTANRWHAKLMFATNNMPQFKDPSGALMRRLLFISFPTSLPDAALDPDLLSKFEPELPGFVAKCMEFGQRVLELNGYPESDAMRELRERIVCNSDSLRLWVKDECEFDPEKWISSAELHACYKSYCISNGLMAMSCPNMSRTLLNRYSQLKPLLKKVGGKAQRGICGIRLDSEKEFLAGAESESYSEQEGDRWLPIIQDMCNQ